MIEFWLTYNNRAESLRLPVPPPEFRIRKGKTIHVVNINNIGEIALIGKSKLSGMEISTFFPAQQYAFCQYSGFPAPYDAVQMIERWWASDNPIRLIITDTPINQSFAIEDFECGEKDGTRDVYFTLSLKEYRFPNVLNTSGQITGEVERTVENEQVTTYTVKEGDTLSIIAKRAYDDSSRYAEIAANNGIADPNMIYPGQVLNV